MCLRNDSQTWIHFNFLQIPVEDLCASFHVWFGDSNLHVKTSWADQGAETEHQFNTESVSLQLKPISFVLCY